MRNVLMFRKFYNRTIQRMFSSISISCQSVGQSNDAAKVTRKKYFHYGIYLFLQQYFLLYLHVMNVVGELGYMLKRILLIKLPTTEDIMNNEVCLADLAFRKKVRGTYPGACAHELKSIIQVVKEVLIGWKDGKANNGMLFIYMNCFPYFSTFLFFLFVTQ